MVEGSTMEDMEISNIKSNIFKNKKVLVTGHTGFKGSWLVTILNYLGAQIMGYALNPEPESLYNTIDGDNICDSVISDIRDFEKVKRAILDFQPDLVFHLAAQSIVLEGYDNPKYTFDVNIMGTINILESLRFIVKPSNCIVITTDKVYKNYGSGKPFNEHDELGGMDPYSASKSAAEIITESYRYSYFNPENYSSHLKCISSARAGNVVGGGDRGNYRLLPDLIRSVENKKTLEIRKPGAVRPWQHVLESIIGYIKLAQAMISDPGNMEIASAWNFGPGPDQVVSVEEVVKKCFDLLKRGNYKVINQNFPKEANILSLSSSKAKRILNWKSVLSWEEVMEYAINEYMLFEIGTEDPKSVIINDFKKIAGWN
jgi:CDP-glucose 4,6-dehydratase